MWQDLAACVGADPELFGPSDTAATYCRGCPVSASCADVADRHKLVGLWAGVYRQGTTGKYRTVALFPGVPTPQLRKRAA